MALDRTKLYKVGGANPAMWIYQSTEAVGDIDNSGYFNAVTNELKQFDVIAIVSATGGTPAIDLATVTSATGAATVTVAVLA